jgi:hypothetical protein
VRCPAGQASLARHSGGAGAPPGSTKRPCQELADDRKAHAKRLRLLLPRRFPSAGMERGRKRREDRRRGTYGESAARRSASHRKKGKRISGAAWRRVFYLRYRASRCLSACWRAERRPRGLLRDRDAIGLRFSARHPFGRSPFGDPNPEVGRRPVSKDERNSKLRMLGTHRGNEGARVHDRNDVRDE